MFFSDVVTADGRQLETWATDSEQLQPQPSKYKFPREQPTDEDWEVWLEFWRNNTQEGWVLPVPLGKWKHLTHRVWRWYYDEKSCGKGWSVYFRGVKVC